MIDEQAERAMKVVQDLLSFARRSRPARVPTIFEDVLDRVLELKSYDLKANRISVSLEPGQTKLPLVLADASQLHQVLFNIVTNAQRAMSQKDGRGHLFIKSRLAGDRVRVSFTHDGPGIPPEQLSSVFDPYFTTEADRGSGLGLSVSHSIINDHGGRLWAESDGVNGATFHLELPAHRPHTS